jgi:nitrogen fixation protein FixH
MSSTSTKPSKKRPAQSNAPMQKTSLTNPITRKESNMNDKNVSIALTANGKFSFSKTFGPWALAIACSATTGGQFHYAHPYVSF